MLKRFLKRQFISFYFDENYKFLKEIYKNNKLIEEEYLEFENKNEVMAKIKELSSQIPQTYTSTLIQSENQGVIPSCEKKEIIKTEDIQNIKYICIKNKYAIFVFLFELMELKKLNTDFIYSPFAVIDYKAEKKLHHLYLLLTKTYFYLLIYYENIPVYFKIFKNSEESKNGKIDLNDFEENEEIRDDLDDLTDDLTDELIIDDNDLIDDLEDIEKVEVEEKEINTSFEFKIIEFLKSSLEDYYKNYAEDFIEEAIILDTYSVNKDLSTLIKDSLLIENRIVKTDILKTINEISRQNV